MINNNSQKGFAAPMIITIIAVILVLGSVAYYIDRSQIKNHKMSEEKTMVEKEAMMEKKGDEMMMMKDE
ncbi:MAG: hypothetical protein AAB325_02405, partial [Pseudomonadota bacterium]